MQILLMFKLEGAIFHIHYSYHFYFYVSYVDPYQCEAVLKSVGCKHVKMNINFQLRLVFIRLIKIGFKSVPIYISQI